MNALLDSPYAFLVTHGVAMLGWAIIAVFLFRKLIAR